MQININLLTTLGTAGVPLIPPPNFLAVMQHIFLKFATVNNFEVQGASKNCRASKSTCMHLTLEVRCYD